MAERVEDGCRHLSGRWQIRWDWWVENVWEPVPSDSWVWKSPHPECMQLGYNWKTLEFQGHVRESFVFF